MREVLKKTINEKTSENEDDELEINYLILKFLLFNFS